MKQLSKPPEMVRRPQIGPKSPLNKVFIIKRFENSVSDFMELLGLKKQEVEECETPEFLEEDFEIEVLFTYKVFQ